MNYNIWIFCTVFLLLFVEDIFAQTQNTYEDEIAKVDFQLYPKTICLGDPLFGQVSISNKTDKPLGFFNMEVRGKYRSKSFLYYELVRNKKRYVGAFEQSFLFPAPRPESGSLNLSVIEPGKTGILESLSFHLPPLEDWHHSFWQDELKELAKSPHGLTYRLEMIVFVKSFTLSFYPEPVRFNREVTIKLRTPKEMELIEKWYKATPAKEFPQLHVEPDFVPGENPKSAYSDELLQYRIGIPYKFPYKKVPEEETPFARHIYGKRYPDKKPYIFLDEYDRYPGMPNLPETWPQWKVLEDSLQNSTMKDNIRLNRMIIQHETTQDADVLNELKEWFDSMNDIQRSAIAKEIRKRMWAIYTYNSNIESMKIHQMQGITERAIPEAANPEFRRFYETIREYDVTLKAKDEKQRMERAGF